LRIIINCSFKRDSKRQFLLIRTVPTIPNEVEVADRRQCRVCGTPRRGYGPTSVPASVSGLRELCKEHVLNKLKLVDRVVGELGVVRE
jgi:hypothetical protein